jgi:hypothetical protein
MPSTIFVLIDFVLRKDDLRGPSLTSCTEGDHNQRHEFIGP